MTKEEAAAALERLGVERFASTRKLEPEVRVEAKRAMQALAAYEAYELPPRQRIPADPPLIKQPRQASAVKPRGSRPKKRSS